MARDREEQREQMAQMMQMIMRQSHEKGVVDNTGSVNASMRARGVTEGPSFSHASLVVSEMGVPPYQIPSLANAILETYLPPPAPMPSEECILTPTCLLQ